jgi:hypothetical protein
MKITSTDELPRDATTREQHKPHEPPFDAAAGDCWPLISRGAQIGSIWRAVITYEANHADAGRLESASTVIATGCQVVENGWGGAI